MATAYGSALMIGLTVQDVNEWPARVRAVTGQGIVAAARSLNKRNAVTAYLVPQPASPPPAAAAPKPNAPPAAAPAGGAPK
jgi:zinc protease